MKSFKPRAPVPHVLLQLSKREHSRLKESCIHLEGLSSDSLLKNIKFDRVIYGDNIRKKKSSITFQDQIIPSYDLTLNRMKRHLVLITALKSECMLIFPELLTTTTTSVKAVLPSDIVVLLACVDRPVTSKNKEWCIDDFKRLKKCKPNILQSSDHHKSTGYYASFGNKGSFMKSTHSSVGQYCSKKQSTLEKQLIINSETEIYERSCADEIERSVKDLNIFVPNIRSILAPVLDTTFYIQTDFKDINLRENLGSINGCWQSSICVNAETQEYHTEHDCTYTLISIPNQSKSKESKMKYDFLFNLTDKQSINIHLKPGVSFMFSGLFLKHRQNKSNTISNSDEPFFNIASYGNKRLFHHLRKTINRI